MNAKPEMAVLTPCNLLSVVLLGLPLLFTGCSSLPKVHTEYDSNTDYGRYKSFSVLSLSTAGTVAPSVGLKLAEPAATAVRTALTTKGLSEAPADKADFAVQVHGESIPEVEVAQYGYVSYPVYGSRRGGWVYSRHYPLTEISESQRLTILIFDNASKKQTWVGWVERSKGTVDAQTVQRAIARILELFPPYAKISAAPK